MDFQTDTAELSAEWYALVMIKSNFSRIYLITIGLAVAGVASMAILITFAGNVPAPILWSVTASTLIGLAGIGVALITLNSASLGRSHNVAILGFPRSGKTTLLVSIFGEIFARRIGIRAIPRGPRNIEMINGYLAMLERGEALRPTTDQDRTAFRMDLTTRHFPFARTYKVDFGDFPGEDTNKYVYEYGEWLHTTPFFRWVLEADALIFVIDLATYLQNTEGRANFVAMQTSAVRAAWQHIVDNYRDLKKDPRRLPVVLAFTKADLFGITVATEEDDAAELLERSIIRLGFGAIPSVHEINEPLLYGGQSDTLKDFDDLLTYLQDEVWRFRAIFVSSFGTFHGHRLGVENLLTAVLPR